MGLRGVSHVIVDEIHERDINVSILSSPQNFIQQGRVGDCKSGLENYA
jgi:HrpA-like RNA helicase